MAIGDEQAPRIPWIDWDELYARDDDTGDTIIPDLAFRGRWTAIVAPAKEGKSTVILGLAVGLARAGFVVMYLDAEMGRGDVLERVEEWMHLQPADLVNLHYTDLPPKLNTVEGSVMLGKDVADIGPDIIIVDGLNGVVEGGENDDTTWRDLYEYAIAPCKVRHIAVVSTDNMGKDRTLGPRGSSVKLDKADAVLALERTDAGVRLTATHRRTAAYPRTQHYVIANASEEGDPMAITAVEGSDPAGTSDMIVLLSNLGATHGTSVRAAKKLLRSHGLKATNSHIEAAVRLWKTLPPDAVIGVPIHRDTARETAGRPSPETGVSTCSTPPVREGDAGPAEPVDNDDLGLW